MIVGSLIMTGKATVKNKDDRKDTDAADLLNIDLPSKFISYLQDQFNQLKAQYGVFTKMIMTRATFVKNIVGNPELGDKFKMILIHQYITSLKI